MPSVTIHELTAAGVVAVHAAIFLTPPPTFALSINYRVMDSIAPEWLWGVAFMLIVGAGTFAARVGLR
jgi:hypothetical protein